VPIWRTNVDEKKLRKHAEYSIRRSVRNLFEIPKTGAISKRQNAITFGAIRAKGKSGVTFIDGASNYSSAATDARNRTLSYVRDGLVVSIRTSRVYNVSRGGGRENGGEYW